MLRHIPSVTLLLLLCTLASEAQTPPLPSKKLTLEGKESTLKIIASKFREQTGVVLDLGKQDPTTKLSLDWNGKPYWEALEELGKQTKCRVVLTDSGVMLVESEEPSLSVVKGPFRLTPTGVNIKRNLTQKTSWGIIELELAWEPGVYVFRSDSRFRATSAKTDSGTPFKADSTSPRHQVTGPSTNLNMNFSEVTRADKSLSIKGEVLVTVCRKWLVHELNPSNGKITTPQDEKVTLNLKKWTKTGNDLTLDLSFEYPSDVTWESFETPFERNTLELISPDGKSISPTRIEGQQSEIRYIFKGTAGELGAGWKVKYRMPGAFEEVKVPFEFKGIPLP